MLKLLPKVSTLPSLVAINIVTVEILIFQNAMLPHIDSVIKGSFGFKSWSFGFKGWGVSQ